MMNEQFHTLSDLRSLLEEALSSPTARLECIKRFQDYVFHHAEPIKGANPQQWDVLNDLALDLDYYEPDVEKRREDSTFYGDERVTEEIREALGKVNQ